MADRSREARRAAVAAGVTPRVGDGTPSLLLRILLDVMPVIGLALAIALFFWKPFWMDETYTAGAVESASVGEMIRHWIGNDVHPPLYYLIDYALVRMFGASELILRLPSLVCYALALATLRFRARALIGNDAARLAAAVFATAFFVLNHAFEARGYVMLMLFSIWACLGFLALRAQPTARATIGFVLAAALMSFTHYFGALFAGTLFLALFARGLQDRRLLRAVSIGALGYALLLLPWLVWHASVLVQIARGGFWIPPFPLWYAAMVAALSCWGGLYGPLWALPALAGLLVGRRPGDWRDDPALDLLAAVLLSVLIVLVISLRVPLVVPRYFSPMLAACILIGGMLVARLSPKVRDASAAIMCVASLTQAVPALSRMPKPMRPLFDPSPWSLAWRDAAYRIMATGVPRVLVVYDGPVIPSFDPRNVAAMGGTFFRHAGYPAEVIGLTSTRDGRLPLGPLPSGEFAVLKIVNDVEGYKPHLDWSDRLLALRRGRCEPASVEQAQVCILGSLPPR